MSEASAVQNPLIKYAEAIGWQPVGPKQALTWRGGDTGLFFTEILREQLVKLNPGFIDGAQADEIIRQLKLLKPTVEGNRAALAWLRGEHSVFVPAENRERNVRLIDFDAPERNLYHVTPEWRQKSAVFANRADVVFLINGLPVATTETKAAGKADGLALGIDQIRRYHRETPELFITSQVFEVTQLLDFFYGPTWNPGRKYIFSWKIDPSQPRQPGPGQTAPSAIATTSLAQAGGAGSYETKIKTFFDRPRFLSVLRDDIVFLTKDDDLTKVILRQHQTRGVEKALARIADPTRRRGLIWHTQGSGKTLTMITIAARLLREAPGQEKPTVLMIVDRNELEAQLFRNIAGYGLGMVKVAQSKRDLVEILAADYRGLILSMIHKFDDIPAHLNPRTGITVLVDEAHRSTGGDLGTYLLAALPNATFIGFTGTPVARLAKGQSTFQVFAPDDPHGYLDKYSIAESIQDGTTVRLNYALAPSDLRVDRTTLEQEFLDLAEAEGVSDIDELNAILNRAVTLKEMMKATERVEQIAQYMARHFRDNVEPMGFKAFLVAVDRPACALYKQALDRYLPPEYSAVVYSPAHNDSPDLKQYHLTTEQEKSIRKDFAHKDKLPKILIVTEKLLTGFDAPILYCMYLDKPMRDHVLLQTIARCNRPYEDEAGLVKPYGFVLDFVGIFERLEKALAFDSEVVEGVIQNIDVLKNLFATLMRDNAPTYLPLAQGWDDKAKERAIDHFTAKEEREAFFKFFRQVQSLYDIISPDAFLRPYLDNYQALAELYQFIRQAYSDRIYVDRELTAKTRELLRQHTLSGRLDLPGQVYEIGPRELAALQESQASYTTKVLNLSKIIARIVDEEGQTKPFLIPIGERAARLIEAWEDRQATTQQTLAGFEELMAEYLQADAESQQLGLDANTYAIYKTLHPLADDLTPAQAQTVNAVFANYPDYEWNAQQAGQLRAELYGVLRPIVGPAKMIAAANALLELQRV